MKKEQERQAKASQETNPTASGTWAQARQCQEVKVATVKQGTTVQMARRGAKR